MDTERNLLFGVVAFQKRAIEADRLAETCADWASDPKHPLADMLVDRGLLTVEQKDEIQQAVEDELKTHGGDPEATLAATMDGQSLDAIRGGTTEGVLDKKYSLPPPQVAHEVLGKLSANDGDNREHRYTLTHLHAKGGMGRVWLARDDALGRRIALKDLRPEQTDNPTVYSRFLYEAKVTAQLEHPGIVPVYELGEGDTPYYTMRFVKGRTLCEAGRDYHKKRAAGTADPVEMVELLTAFVGICHAIAYAHDRGFIHRDLKGQNVVLGDFGEVMVLDWGLAKQIGLDAKSHENVIEQAEPAHDPYATLDNSVDFQLEPTRNGRSHGGANPSSATDSRHASFGSRRTIPGSGAGPEGTILGHLLGTPSYMAPEQAQGKHDIVDYRTDVYGLGAILYEIVTGRPPFIGTKTSEIIRKVCKEAPTPPRRILASVPPELEAVCLKALAKDQANRYQSAAEVGQEVQRFLADEPVHAYAEPWIRRAARWARKHRTAVAAGLGLLLTGTSALAVGTVLVARERNEAEAQGRQAREAVHLLVKGGEIGFDDEIDPTQREFLEQALVYFDQYTTRVGDNPGVRLEHAQACQEMGDILRKLGRYAESERAYRKAIDLLRPVAGASRDLARVRALLGDLLVRSGRDKDEAKPLYEEALKVQRALAGGPGATPLDFLRMGQSLKSLGDLLRLKGSFSLAKPLYDDAITSLDRARNGDLKQGEATSELALAYDARGWIERELGEFEKSEQDDKAAISLLEKLVAQFPTVPRHREVLAKVYNSLALIEQDTGRQAAAEANFRRELPLVERLAQDYPDRPEHKRELARTLMNLGNLIVNQGQGAESRAILARAIEINQAIHDARPDDVQIRLDLAKCRHNLGVFLHNRGESKEAAASLEQARTLSESLVKEFPDKPRYAAELARNLLNLALAWEVLEPAKAVPAYQAALDLYQKLADEYPDNIDYRTELVHCLRNFGPVVAAAGQPDRALGMFERALGLLAKQTPAERAKSRDRADILNNKGELEREMKRPGALASLQAAQSIYENLAKSTNATSVDHHRLAIAQFNIGNFLVEEKRFDLAGPLLAEAVAGFDTLVSQTPRSLDLENHFGLVLSVQGELFHKTGKPALARDALRAAVTHQKLAAKLSRYRDSIRALLGSHLLALSQVNLELSDYTEASAVALELPAAVPIAARGQACLDSARILAKLVAKAVTDGKLTKDNRDRLVRGQIGRAVVLLREAIDANPKLADTLKADPDFKPLEAHEEYQAIMSTLVGVAR